MTLQKEEKKKKKKKEETRLSDTQRVKERERGVYNIMVHDTLCWAGESWNRGSLTDDGQSSLSTLSAYLLSVRLRERERESVCREYTSGRNLL